MQVQEWIGTLTVAELNGLVAEHKIELPAGCKKKADIAAAIIDWTAENPDAISAPAAAPAPVAPKGILDGLVLSQGGKPVTGDPVKDNYAVRAAEGHHIVNPVALVARLRAAYPGCVFTWFAK